MYRPLWDLNVKVHVENPGFRGGRGAVVKAVGIRSSLVCFSKGGYLEGHG